MKDLEKKINAKIESIDEEIIRLSALTIQIARSDELRLVIEELKRQKQLLYSLLDDHESPF